MSEPSYYNCNGLSPLDAFRDGLISKEEYVGFLKGNIIKYVVRCDKKDDPVKDLNKLMDYASKLMMVYLDDYDHIKNIVINELLDDSTHVIDYVVNDHYGHIRFINAR